MVLGMKVGLDPTLIHDVLPKGAGGSTMLQVRGEYMAKSDYRYEDGTIFDIIRKDASIISEYAAELNARSICSRRRVRPLTQLWLSAWIKWSWQQCAERSKWRLL